jgi:hypothetical protein
MSWGDIAKKFVTLVQGSREIPRLRQHRARRGLDGEGRGAGVGTADQRRETYALRTVPAGRNVPHRRRRRAEGPSSTRWSAGAAASVLVDRLRRAAGRHRGSRQGPWSPGRTSCSSARSPTNTATRCRSRMICVDSGFNTQHGLQLDAPVSAEPRRRGEGPDYGGVLVGSPSPVEITINGRKLKRGARVWPTCASDREERVVRLPEARGADGRPRAAAPGFCHFPQYADEYFKQLTAEQLIPHRTEAASSGSSGS